MSAFAFYRSCRAPMLTVLGCLMLAAGSPAQDTTQPPVQTLPLTLELREHRFVPAELRVPANQRIQLNLQNHDNATEEFESYDLNREQRVAPAGKLVILLGPLPPGRYAFFGDFHRATAQGTLVVE